MVNILQGSPAYLFCLALLYLVFARTLRYNRSNAVRRKFPTRESYGSMTLEEAFAIQSRLAEVEFPTIFSGSVFFALFKASLCSMLCLSHN